MKKELATTIQNKLQEKGIYADVCPLPDGVEISLSWEDWKVHIAVRNLLGNMELPFTSEVTDSDDSDCFSAVYTVEL